MVLYLKTFKALKETEKYLKRENLTESFYRQTFLNCQRIKVSLLHVVKKKFREIPVSSYKTFGT